jgi:PKD repeat protein
MLYYDQSLGVHNPTYVKALLADAENRVFNQFTASNYLASFAANVVSGTNSLTVTFNNYNLTGTVYNWDFGDGNLGGGPNPTHNYAAPGVYSVTCTVDGKPMTRTKYISVQ